VGGRGGGGGGGEGGEGGRGGGGYKKGSFFADVLNGRPLMTSTRQGKGVRLRWTHVHGGKGHFHVDIHRKLEPTDITLSSSHAK